MASQERSRTKQIKEFETLERFAKREKNATALFIIMHVKDAHVLKHSSKATLQKHMAEAQHSLGITISFI